MATPQVSVVLPFYNAERMLRQAVDSVLASTFTDFELILVDDGSSDGSVDSLSGLDDRRLRLIRQENAGPAAAKNVGLRLAQGEFVVRMDADDVCRSGRIEHQLQYLQEHAETVLVGGQIERLAGERELGHSALPTRDQDIRTELRAGRHALCDPTTMFRHQAAMDIGGYWDHGVAEDWDLYLRLGRLGRLENLNEVVLSYRYHAGSINSCSLFEVRRNIWLAIENDRRCDAGLPSLAPADFWRACSWQSRARIQREVHGMRAYRRSMTARASDRPIVSLGFLGVAVACLPAQALGRLSDARSQLRH